jgi:quaternary ammonium compound-resistance protein SugE
MNWLILIIAGIFEVAFATCIGKVKETTGNTATWWFIGFVVCLTVSIYLLYKASLTLPIGTAYAVWTGIGAVGIVLVGIFHFKEPLDFWRMFFLATLIVSIIGLKLVTK